MSSYPSIEPSSTIGTRDVMRLVLRRGWVVIVIMVITIAIALVVTKKTQKLWTATAMLVTSNTSNNTTGTTASESQPTTQMQMLQSQYMAQRTIDWLRNQANVTGQPFEFANLTPQQLLDAMTVDNPQESNLIKVKVDWTSPTGAQQLANGVCGAFMSWNKEIVHDNLNQNAHDLKQRLAAVHLELLAANLAVENFKESHNMAAVKAMSEAQVGQFETATSNVMQLKAQVAAQQAQVTSLENQVKAADKSILTTKSVRDDQVIAALQAQYESELETYNQDRLKLLPNYPGMPQRKQHLEQLKAKIAGMLTATIAGNRPTLSQQSSLADNLLTAQNTLISTQTQLASATTDMDRLNLALKGLPAIERQYEQLVANAEGKQKFYDSLQQQVMATNLATIGARLNTEIAQKAAVPDAPSHPNLYTNLAFGGVIGLILGLATVVLLEQTDQRLRNTSHARGLLPGAVIGALPRVNPQQIRGILEGSGTGRVAESYSLARANLALALRNLGQGSHIVMVTSALPGEGKSVTAAALAKSSSRAGKRVILIEADMRRPSLNSMFGTDERAGLAEVLGGTMSLDDVLVSADQDNLTLLYSGTPTINPSDLIARPAMVTILEALRAEADIIFIDTPPCSLVADALVLAPLVDCILQVVSLDMADQPTTLETTAALRAADPAKMVYFINRAPDEPNKSYTTYYGGHGTNGSYAGQNLKLKALSAAPAPSEAAQENAPSS